MRCGYKDVDVTYTEDNKLMGICLGWDFVSEHEHSIKDLCDKFKTKPKKLGLEGLKIHNNITRSMFITQGEDNKLYIVLTSYKYALTDLSHYMEKPFSITLHNGEDIVVYTAWDDTDFILIMEASPNSQSIISELAQAFYKHDVCFAFSDNANPFARNGLNILIYSRIPKKCLDDIIATQKHNLEISQAFDKHLAIQKLHAAKSEWQAKNPRSHSTPFDYYALSPRGETIHDTTIWLNPANPQHLNYNNITFKDVEDWVNGVPGVIIKSKEHWEELKYITSDVCPRSHSIAYNLQHFRGVKAAYKRKVRADEMRSIIPLPKKGKLTDKALDVIDAHVKSKMYYDINCAMEIHGKKFNEINDLSRECSDEIHGFFDALALTGYGYFEYSNSPEQYENFSWYRDILFTEVLWELAIKFGVAFQPWIDNKTSLCVRK